VHNTAANGRCIGFVWPIISAISIKLFVSETTANASSSKALMS
jgi:hypothetical protein